MNVTNFELNDLLQAIGPTASLIFAAWIFLSFLQQRYSTAYNLYRALIAELRQHPETDKRRESLCEQILEYKRRCQQMRLAAHIGLLAAIALISTIILAVLNTVNEEWVVLKFLAALLSVVGLLLVIWAAILVVIENLRLQLIIDSDLSDIPDLAHGAA